MSAVNVLHLRALSGLDVLLHALPFAFLLGLRQ
ncbi:hypothetical protein P3T16_006757 [Paraburkholderia sp. GAS42]